MNNSMRPRLIVGLDPDSEATGYAVLDMEQRQLSLARLGFPELLECMRLHQGQPVLYVLEDVWTNSANWHIKQGQNIATVAKIGYDLGRCAQTGRMIQQLAQSMNLSLIVQRPLSKRWRTPTGKVSHQQLLGELQRHRVTLAASRSSQDERDAALLALHHIATRLPASLDNH